MPGVHGSPAPIDPNLYKTTISKDEDVGKEKFFFYVKKDGQVGLRDQRQQLTNTVANKSLGEVSQKLNEQLAKFDGNHMTGEQAIHLKDNVDKLNLKIKKHNDNLTKGWFSFITKYFTIAEVKSKDLDEAAEKAKKAIVEESAKLEQYKQNQVNFIKKSVVEITGPVDGRTLSAEDANKLEIYAKHAGQHTFNGEAVIYSSLLTEAAKGNKNINIPRVMSALKDAFNKRGNEEIMPDMQKHLDAALDKLTEHYTKSLNSASAALHKFSGSTIEPGDLAAQQKLATAKEAYENARSPENAAALLKLAEVYRAMGNEPKMNECVSLANRNLPIVEKRPRDNTGTASGYATNLMNNAATEREAKAFAAFKAEVNNATKEWNAKSNEVNPQKADVDAAVLKAGRG